jgi:CheY-like chemotaxis protein
MLKRKILLVEDDVDDQRFFNEFLQNRKDLVLLPIADNGEVLFEILHSISKSADLPDYIILDQNMPKINGLQALQLLKADTRYAHIPVSIYSTYTDEDLIQKGMATGACDVVSKPISKEGYNQMVDAFFRACDFI